MTPYQSKLRAAFTNTEKLMEETTERMRVQNIEKRKIRGMGGEKEPPSK